MKNIIITGGPTNEYIDEVMKITNMSTGSLSLSLVHEFVNKGYRVTFVVNPSVRTDELIKHQEDNSMVIHTAETTEEMLNSLEALSRDGISYDLVLHAAAVGDYKADFTFLMDDLAHQLFLAFKEGNFNNEEQLLTFLKNGAYRIDNQSKISSYQDSLTVKLALTPKIIKNLRSWFPQSLLIGCKLLDKVSKEELFEVAKHLAVKNEMDYILANDLKDLREGKVSRYLVDSKGYIGIELKSAQEICDYIHQRI